MGNGYQRRQLTLQERKAAFYMEEYRMPEPVLVQTLVERMGMIGTNPDDVKYAQSQLKTGNRFRTEQRVVAAVCIAAGYDVNIRDAVKALKECGYNYVGAIRRLENQDAVSNEVLIGDLHSADRLALHDAGQLPVEHQDLEFELSSLARLVKQLDPDEFGNVAVEQGAFTYMH